MKHYRFFLLIFCLFTPKAFAQNQNIDAIIDQNYSSLEQLYQQLHSNPELSYFEANTAKRIADELRNAGFDVTENFGKYLDASRKSYGLVGVLRNGKGPTVMFRTDLDGLPVEEKTGLPYASKVKTKDDDGKEVPVMHACGHDMHMTVFTGVARALSAMKDQWSGT